MATRLETISKALSASKKTAYPLRIIECQSPDEFRFGLEQGKLLDWNDNFEFIIPWFAQDPHGFLVGVVYNDQKLSFDVVSSVMGVKQGEQPFGHISYFIVKEEYRGEGFGKPIFNSVMKHLSDCKTIGLEAVEEHRKTYEKAGFKSVGEGARVTLTVSETMKRLLRPATLEVVPISEDNLGEVARYDSSISASDRSHILKTFKNSVVAKDAKSGQVVGYAGIDKLPKGYYVRPLFAESREIADTLFREVISSLPLGELVQVDLNLLDDGIRSWYQQFDFKVKYKTHQMWTNGIPKGMDFSRMYFRCSTDCGA